jgi:hypothetical protein
MTARVRAIRQNGSLGGPKTTERLPEGTYGQKREIMVSRRLAHTFDSRMSFRAGLPQEEQAGHDSDESPNARVN